MVKHIVMFKFLPEADNRSGMENAAIVGEMLGKLQGRVPSLVASKVTLNSENADKTNYDLVLECEFNDWEGLSAYIVHPEHKAVGAFMKPLRESRSCVDYEF